MVERAYSNYGVHWCVHYRNNGGRNHIRTGMVNWLGDVDATGCARLEKQHHDGVCGKACI